MESHHAVRRYSCGNCFMKRYLRTDWPIRPAALCKHLGDVWKKERCVEYHTRLKNVPNTVTQLNDAISMWFPFRNCIVKPVVNGGNRLRITENKLDV
jgi:uncharacterized cysteine cluster protein YcgN (CxxCxxCC family)